MKKAYGFKSNNTIETALYHQLGKIPEPETKHSLLTRPKYVFFNTPLESDKQCRRG